MPWETFITHDIFKGPQIFVDLQVEGGPSGQQREHEIKTEEAHIPMFINYEKGTRRLFAAAKQVLSPPRVEGVLFPSPNHRQMLSSPGVKGDLPSSSAEQVQEKGKQPLHDDVRVPP